MTDIFNLKKIAEKMQIEGSNLYHRLGYAMKGAIDQLDEQALDELKRVITEETTKTVKFIDELKKKQCKLQKAS